MRLKKLKEKKHLFKMMLSCIGLILFSLNMFSQETTVDSLHEDIYLNAVKLELQKKWPENKTINLVFHGHSVPSGYFKTPNVNTLSAYPQLVLKKLKAKYPYAVINSITTSIGGENSVEGAKRFKDEVLNHKPDVLFIDYGLNDRRVSLDKAKQAWKYMIELALKQNIPVILLTPSPDYTVDYTNPKNILKKHTNQIKLLSKTYNIGLVDSYKAFEFLYDDIETLKSYMAQGNHPNEKGHELIANEIIKYFQ
ncbi:lipase [Seonamhaeicola sp. S2-3]|uniref:SGNH/GDSL hydrolase family protein n=1 Tax=Seonamhaeicola sp. S2-3 TaxID=1936081 RepID=UPI0009728C76|nr:GDSL-type esterase/lipase family protein [Seonamhaeicola sp. S2-3]APY11617.1 lipase [Seonamhaeicola sp. S2-3]